MEIYSLEGIEILDNQEDYYNYSPYEEILFDTHQMYTINSSYSKKVNNFVEFSVHKFIQAQEREFFYIKAIRNLIKQRDFLTLLNEHANDLISSEQFSEELENNESKYMIDVNLELDSDNIHTIVDIIKKLDITMYENELSEIFSIDLFSSKHFFIHNNSLEE